MPFRDILGQSTAIETLQRALASSRVHHAYRFEGPEGVGKERVAIGLAQSLLCERPLGGLACRECSSCRRAVTFAEEPPQSSLHPDLVMVARAFYPPQLIGADEPERTAISVRQVRKVILGRVGMPPHEGRALVFIVRDADELHPSAANALLKTLEEPANRVHFILLTSRPNQLLDTIRSRTLSVRFAPLPDIALQQILDRHGGSHEVIPMAQGSASLALRLSDSEQLKEREDFLGAIERALSAPDLATAMGELDMKQGSRETLTDELGWLLAHLAAQAKQAAMARNGLELRYAEQHAAVLTSLRDLQRNGQPALMVESLLTRMRRLQS